MEQDYSEHYSLDYATLEFVAIEFVAVAVVFDQFHRAMNVPELNHFV